MKRITSLLLLLPTVVFAQETTLNPTKAQFTASLDHATVTRYELRHYIVGQLDPVRVDNLGKHTPDATNTITAVFPALTQDSAKRYEAKVVAISSTGEGVSTASNTYLFASGVQLAVTQKVDLTLVGYDSMGNPLPPAATISVWTVNDPTAGTFTTVRNADGSSKPLAAWFIPLKVGVYEVTGSFAIENPIPKSFNAKTTVVVTLVAQ